MHSSYGQSSKTYGASRAHAELAVSRHALASLQALLVSRQSSLCIQRRCQALALPSRLLASQATPTVKSERSGLQGVAWNSHETHCATPLTGPSDDMCDAHTAESPVGIKAMVASLCLHDVKGLEVLPEGLCCLLLLVTSGGACLPVSPARTQTQVSTQPPDPLFGMVWPRRTPLYCRICMIQPAGKRHDIIILITSPPDVQHRKIRPMWCGRVNRGAA